MNSENFHEYLKNPSMLHQVNYQELKSLVLQYPYSPNLRYLLLIKSLFDQNKDYERNLALASMHSPDRRKLRQLVKQLSRMREMQDNYALSEDFLELKDLSSMENMLESAPAVEPSQSPTHFEMSLESPSSLEDIRLSGNDVKVLFQDEDESIGFLEELSDAAEVDDKIMIIRHLDDVIEHPKDAPAGIPATLEEILPAEMAEEKTPTDAMIFSEAGESAASVETGSQEDAEMPGKGGDVERTGPNIVSDFAVENLAGLEREASTVAVPSPKSSFESWVRQGPDKAPATKFSLHRQRTAGQAPIRTPDLIKKSKPRRRKKDHSLEEDYDIATETLAKLYEKQGHYKKAIAMYERLCLVYPEKSGLFAAKIDELNQKR